MRKKEVKEKKMFCIKWKSFNELLEIIVESTYSSSLAILFYSTHLLLIQLRRKQKNKMYA